MNCYFEEGEVLPGFVTEAVHGENMSRIFKNVKEMSPLPEVSRQ